MNRSPNVPQAGGGEAPKAASAKTVFSLPEAIAAKLHDAQRLAAFELAAAESREAKALLLHEQAEYEERVRGDEPVAARGYLAAFNARPMFRPPLDALIRLYARRRSAANISKLYDALVKAGATPVDRAESLTLRAELLEDRLQDPKGAAELFEAAVAADPTYRLAWLDLYRASLHGEDRAGRVRALTHLAALTQDEERRSLVLLELASEHVRAGAESIDEASRRIREAASLSQGRWRALTELERLGEAYDRPRDLVDALEGRADLAEQVVRGDRAAGASGAFSATRIDSRDEARALAADLRVRAAWTRLLVLHDADGARATMQRAIDAEPDDPRYRFLSMLVADQSGDIGAASQHAQWLLARDFGDPSLRASLHRLPTDSMPTVRSIATGKNERAM